MFSLPRWTLFLAAALYSNSSSRPACAQGSPETRFAIQVQSAVDFTAAKPTLSAWRRSHGRERIDSAHYETDRDRYEVNSQNQWCVTSVAEVSVGVTRAASFYVPEIKPGALPPLPTRQDPALKADCRLAGIWFEAKGQTSASGLIKELSAAWGAPKKPARAEASNRLRIRGSSLWKDVSSWRQGIVTVWVGWTDWDKGNGVGARTIVWIVRDRPRDPDLFTAGFDVREAALRIAALNPSLTAALKPQTNCAALGATETLGRLSRWLQASKALPAERRGAALLAADSFVGCALMSGAKPDSLKEFGVKFTPVCGQDEPSYAGNFRLQAEVLGAMGRVEALAVLASLQNPCSLQGAGSWPDRLLNKGQKVIRTLQPAPWSPWVHLAMARAHAAKLAFSVPPGEADIETVHPLSAAEARRERSAAIAEFARFVQESPAAPEAGYAWQEAWRLLAGLLPSPIGFGCGCE